MIRSHGLCLGWLPIALMTGGAFASAQQSGAGAPAASEETVRKAGQEQPPKPPQAPAQQEGPPSPVIPRQNLRDEQQSAPRPGNLTLDPKYVGFVPIPGTPVLIKFNAKPRVDATLDNRNSGDNTRFVTARIPVEEDPVHGGGRQFNINAKGSQLSLDVRAPEVDGSPRFFYQNDFFGAGPGEFPYRVRHLYGQIYNIIVGMTFSVFEDPDAWPDTVDYEGPNSAVFARRPLARFMWPLSDRWHVNFGIEQPGAEIDTNIDPDADPVNRSPDVGVNLRWEEEKISHVQIATILRDLGVRGPITGRQSTFGWGVNLSGSVTVWGKDSLQFQFTFGEGIFRYFNDDFVNNDAAFDSGGDLTAIPALGIMGGFTHHWTEEFRSTATYGFVRLDNQASQSPDAYGRTHYASLNVIWQIRKRLSIGLEGLYGQREDNAERDGDVFRLQLGLLYSLFD